MDTIREWFDGSDIVAGIALLIAIIAGALQVISSVRQQKLAERVAGIEEERRAEERLRAVEIDFAAAVVRKIAGRGGYDYLRVTRLGAGSARQVEIEVRSSIDEERGNPHFAGTTPFPISLWNPGEIHHFEVAVGDMSLRARITWVNPDGTAGSIEKIATKYFDT